MKWESHSPRCRTSGVHTLPTALGQSLLCSGTPQISQLSTLMRMKAHIPALWGTTFCSELKKRFPGFCSSASQQQLLLLKAEPGFCFWPNPRVLYALIQGKTYPWVELNPRQGFLLDFEAQCRLWTHQKIQGWLSVNNRRFRGSLLW